MTKTNERSKKAIRSDLKRVRQSLKGMLAWARGGDLGCDGSQQELDGLKHQVANLEDELNETKTPAAACPRCGGWTGFGGMSQHSQSTIPVMGRLGCSC